MLSAKISYIWEWASVDKFHHFSTILYVIISPLPKKKNYKGQHKSSPFSENKSKLFPKLYLTFP